MKVSIVTISYNQAEYLEECILSILNQDYPNIEYIIVDPGSTDGSRDIIEKYRDRISHIVYEKDDGAADGLNRGFELASGEIFGFVNSDDTLLPGALKKVTDTFLKNKKIDVVNGSGFFTNAEGKPTKHILPTKFSSWLYAYGGVTLFQQGTFFKRELFKEIGGFNTNNHTCWDGELFLDFAIHKAKFKCLYEDVATFRMHEEGISGSGRLIEKYKQDNNRLFKKAMRRDKSILDSYISIFARLIKIIVNPKVFCLRLLGFDNKGFK